MGWGVQASRCACRAGLQGSVLVAVVDRPIHWESGHDHSGNPDSPGPWHAVGRVFGACWEGHRAHVPPLVPYVAIRACVRVLRALEAGAMLIDDPKASRNAKVRGNGGMLGVCGRMTPPARIPAVPAASPSAPAPASGGFCALRAARLPVVGFPGILGVKGLLGVRSGSGRAFHACRASTGRLVGLLPRCRASFGSERA